MNTLEKLLVAVTSSLLLASSVDAQTLKMTHQVVRIATYETSTSVNLVVVKPEFRIEALDPSAFVVETNGIPRNVKIIYTCDERGEWADSGEYLAFGLEASPERSAAPMQYKNGSYWIPSYPVKVSLKPGKTIKVAGKKYTSVDCAAEHVLDSFLSEADYFSRGTFTGTCTGRLGDITLTYGAYEPEALRADGKKNPLVIWLHGGGEGGTDVSIALMGNEAVALIRSGIQSHFTTEGGKDGAYVLAVQCPTMWMDTVKGFNDGGHTSLYADVLKSCIDHYLVQNPDVDPCRVYVGGCSNGGYMTVSLLLRHPGFFAAAYPTCEAYADVNISDVQIGQLSKENIWFVQSFDDMTVKPEKYCIPTYLRLQKAGAKNVWMSMFENVIGTDQPGQKIYGHSSWVYLFNDQVTGAQQKSEINPTNDGGGSVAPQGHSNIFEWMNAQSLSADAQ